MAGRAVVTSAGPIRAFLVADIRLYRDGIVRALADSQVVQIIGATSPTAPDCEYQIKQASPAILLIEGSAIRDDALWTRVDSIAPGCRVVAFGVIDDEREVIHCIERGVAGFISRDAALDELTEIVQSVARGEFSCSARESALLLRGVRNLTADRRGGPLSSLTLREQQVIALVDNGLSNKDIAQRLGIELSTVKNHMHNILSKLHTSRRGQAAASVRLTSSESRLTPAVRQDVDTTI